MGRCHLEVINLRSLVDSNFASTMSSLSLTPGGLGGMFIGKKEGRLDYVTSR